MYVRDHMTIKPVMITKDVSVSDALDLMQKGKFHRLPVVDEDNRLIGLITEGLVTEASGEKTTSLSIYELNYLLARTKVDDIMIRNVVTVKDDVFVEEAAQIMIDNQINVLPVVDDFNKVIGIITEKDIFQTFVELLGLGKKGTKFVIKMDDKPGNLALVAKLFAEENANVEALGVYHNNGTEFFVKATGDVSVEEMTELLKKNNLTVTRVIQTTKNGEKVEFNI